MQKDFYKTYFKLEKDNWWFRVRRNIVLSLIKKYKISKEGEIFDFGCGSGYLVGYLQKLGYNVSGSDISQEAIEFGKAKDIHGLEVVQNDQIKTQNGGFEVILTLDVIEHIEDDLGAIRAIQEALKPGGTAIITVPAYQWMWGVQDEVAHHFRRYNMKSLLKLFEHTNLSVVKKSYFNTFLFLPIATVRLVSKLLKLESRESDFELNNKFINKILFTIFNIEAKLLRSLNFPFGVSILLVLKKNV